MTEAIRPLTADQVRRMYDALHLMGAEARHSYLAAEHAMEEEFHRGRREAIDAVLTELDIFVDEQPRATGATTAPDSRGLDETANDLELAYELLPHVPTDDAELGDVRWEVARALHEARREGAAVQLAELAEELSERAAYEPPAACAHCGWSGPMGAAEMHGCKPRG